MLSTSEPAAKDAEAPDIPAIVGTFRSGVATRDVQRFLVRFSKYM